METKIHDLESAIHVLDRIFDSRDLNDMESARLNAANCLLNQWLIKRKRVWRQRARSYGFNMKVRNYFVQRFQQQQTPAFDFNLDNHQRLSLEQAAHLENIPSREEVQQAVW